MDTFIEALNLNIEILSPVHITDGSQDEMSPLEYVITDEKQLYHFDFPGFVHSLEHGELKEFNHYTEINDSHRICKFIGDLWNRYPERFSELILWSSNACDLVPYYKSISNNPDKRLFLKPFIKSNRHCFFPGSSLKGTMRTALISCLMESDSLEKDVHRDSLNLEAETMWYLSLNRNGYLVPNTIKDPFKALKINDNFIKGEESSIKRIYNVKQYKGRFESKESKGILNFAECLMPGAQSEFQISMDYRFFRSHKKSGRRFAIQELVSACKVFYERVLTHEKQSFFDAFSMQNHDSNVADLYEHFLDVNKKQNCFLFRIGRFIGKNSTSFNLLSGHIEKPVSRNLIEYEGQLIPMGWIKASF